MKKKSFPAVCEYHYVVITLVCPYHSINMQVLIFGLKISFKKYHEDSNIFSIFEKSRHM